MIFKKIEAELQEPESEQVRFERVLDALYGSYRKIYLSQIEQHINRLNVPHTSKESLLATACECMNRFQQHTDGLSLKQKADLAIKTSVYLLDTNLIRAAEHYLIENYGTTPLHADLKAVLSSKRTQASIHAAAVALVETTLRYKAAFDKAHKPFLDSIGPTPAPPSVSVRQIKKNKTK